MNSLREVIAKEKEQRREDWLDLELLTGRLWEEIKQLKGKMVEDVSTAHATPTGPFYKEGKPSAM
jgi:hypothetical protein